MEQQILGMKQWNH